MNFKVFGFLLILASLLACNTSVLQAKLLEQSSKKMPAWIGKTSEDKSKLYFSGSSTGQETFETARKLAVSDALTQIIESLDLTMSVNSNKLLTATEVYLEDRTTSKTGNVRILQAKINDIYFEKYEDNGKLFYNVHVLMEYGKKEYQNEKNRLAKEYEDYRQNVANLWAKANQMVKTNNCSEALPELFEALKVINNYGVSRSLEYEILARINNLFAEIVFNDSYSSSENQSGVNAKISVLFSGTKEKCKNFIFTVKTLNNFSIDTVYSDENGQINYIFKKVSYLKKSNYKLDLNIIKLYNLDDEFVKAYKFREVSKDLNFLGDKRRIKLNVSGVKNGDELINFIKSNLVQNGFTVTDDGNDLILNVIFSFKETTKSSIRSASGSDTNLFISGADVSAELLSKDNNQINSVSFEDRGFGKTAVKSYSDLLQKVSSSIINTL